MRWSETVTLAFVKIYLKYECLWNPSHPGYKLRRQREKAYIEISSEFKVSTGKSLSIPEVKIKIKNLRTTYIQQVHKILHRSSPDNIYEPSLIWFHEMDRCLKFIPTNRHSSSYSNNEETEVDSSCQIWINQESKNDNIEDCKPDPLIPQADDDDEDLPKQEEPSMGNNKDRDSSPVHYKKHKKKKLKHRNSVQDEADCTDNTREDEFDIFGKFIAWQLRKMNLNKALRLQLEIHSLVSEARMSDIVEKLDH